MDSSNVFNFEAGKSNVSSLMSFLTTPTSASASSTSTSSTFVNERNHQPVSHQSSGKDPTDIPKDELMALCMKLNKKMQSLESKCHDLNRQKTGIADDKSFLVESLGIVLNTNIPNQSDQVTDRQLIQSLISNWKLIQQENISSLERKVIELESDARVRKRENLTTSKSETESTDIVKDELLASETQVDELFRENEILRKDLSEMQLKERKAEQDMKNLEANNKSVKEQLQRCENEVKEKVLKLSSLQKEFEENKTKHEENVMYLSMQLNTFKMRSDGSESEIASLSMLLNEAQEKIVKDATDKSQDTILQYEKELSMLKEQVLELESNLNEAINSKSEQEALTLTFRRDLNKTLQLKDEYASRIKDLQEDNTKLLQQVEMNQKLKEEIDRLKSSAEDNSSLIKRLRQESLLNERNHAMKTAVLATAEVQLDQLRRELVLKEETTKEALERVSLLQVRLAGAESRLEERVKEMSIKTDEMLKNEEILKKTHEEQIFAIKDKYDVQVESIQRENAKKSSIARLLLSEKEEEIRVLQAKIFELQTEINSGAPQERRIFELAGVQAKRDAVHGVHNENREMAFQQLLSALEAKDLELARFQQIQAQLSGEVIELRRITKREGVNMDYLKNIILQYMTFPVTSPERQQLVPVISMLLQFNSKELVEVEKSTKEPMWTSNRPVIEIKRSLKNAFNNESPR